MTEERGLSPLSVRSHRWKASRFLTWFSERHPCLASVRLQDVDEFLILQGSTRWNRTSVTVAAQALRAFFRHAERRGWCRSGIAEGIVGPRRYVHEGLPEGPTWTEVQRLLEGVKGTSASALRARAILSLFAIYGLRSGEVSRLLLSDFDWSAETFLVTHSKRGGRRRPATARGRRSDPGIHHQGTSAHRMPSSVRDAPCALPECCCRELMGDDQPAAQSGGHKLPTKRTTPCAMPARRTCCRRGFR